MSIFEYTPEELLGTVESVDTSTVIVKLKMMTNCVDCK